MTAIKNLWSVSGNDYFLSEEAQQINLLDPAIYTLNNSLLGLYLQRTESAFAFDYKIYGKDTPFVNRMIKTYYATTGNLGALLNGVKGTGKTVTSKLLSNEFISKGIPVILINTNYSGINEFINKIPQDVVLVFDEFEKNFSDKNGQNAGQDLLSLMDGVFSGNHRRVFLLTTNNTYVNPNLLERPSRIRYIKQYRGLDLDTIIEVVDDKLKVPSLREECIQFISELQEITIDIVKGILEEVNIHEESPYAFSKFFNIKLMDRKKSIYEQTYDEGGKLLTSKLAYKQVEVNFSKFLNDFDEPIVLGKVLTCGKNYYGDVYLGKVIEVIDRDTIKLAKFNEETDEYDGDEVIYSLTDALTFNSAFRNYNFAF